MVHELMLSMPEYQSDSQNEQLEIGKLIILDRGKKTIIK